MKVIILRGLPGSGKSTFAKKTWPDARICSADDFFMVPGALVGVFEGSYKYNPSVYKYDPTKIGEAHADCFRRFLSSIEAQDRSGIDTIIVDNTHTRAVEIAPYVLAASAFGVKDIKVITFHCSPEVAASRNVHGVPAEVINKMVEVMRTDELPPWWIHEEIGTAPVRRCEVYKLVDSCPKCGASHANEPVCHSCDHRFRG